MAAHTVEPGECILSIATQYSFFWKTLWNHPDNQKLNELRKNPALLVPGDVVQIPDKAAKQKLLSMGKKHGFQIKRNRAVLRLRLVDSGKPIADEPFVLLVDGKKIKGKTDADGKIEQPISTGATTAELRLETRRHKYVLELGHLPPVEEVAGAQARLASLGFYEGHVEGDFGPFTREAVETFQAAMALDISGELNQGTRDKLKSAFGC